MKHPRDLIPLLVDSTMSFFNSNLKTLNVGIVVAHSSDNRSYHIQTESGTVISCNRIHLGPVNFVQQAQQSIPRTVTSIEGLITTSYSKIKPTQT